MAHELKDPSPPPQKKHVFLLHVDEYRIDKQNALPKTQLYTELDKGVGKNNKIKRIIMLK